jgi:3-phenylpropionate/trans-cinnamate dioxygenase ferredoxin subunit
MTDWIDVAPVAELAPGQNKIVDVEGTDVAIFNVDGDYYAIEDVCSHDGGELASGKVCGLEIECPRHGAHFDLATGEALTAPAYEDIAVFPVRVADGIIQIRDTRWDD